MATQVSLNSGAVASAGALALQTNGTTEAVSISTGQVATLAQNPILTSGTANGVAYLNGSKAVTSGSALTFDGTNLGIGTSSPSYKLDVSGTGSIGARITGTASASLILNNASGYFGYLQYNSAGAGGLYFYDVTNSTIRAVIDASGNLGIGTTSPAQKLDVYLGTTGTVGQYLRNTTINLLSKIDGTTAAQFGTETSHPLAFITGNTERARIDSSGNLLVGATSNAVGAYTAKTLVNSGSANGRITVTTSAASYSDFFFTSSSTLAGSIYINGAATTYNTSSDYRLKDISGPVTGLEAKNFIMALQPKQGTWKSDGSRFVGFLAHEFQEVSPSSVSGVKDAVDEDGNPIMQGMQASSSEVMANLIALVQEQQFIITQLTARITALEGA